ncbi:AAEL005396-PA, partial [Aedes aegypti]
LRSSLQSKSQDAQKKANFPSTAVNGNRFVNVNNKFTTSVTDPGLTAGYGPGSSGVPLATLVKIKSMNNLSVTKSNIFFTEDEVDCDAVDKNRTIGTPGQQMNLSRMKSLGNLSAYEREFGTTPVDLLKLKKDFELRRFSCAKMKSLTDLNDDNEDAMVQRRKQVSKENVDQKTKNCIDERKSAFQRNGADLPNRFQPFQMRNSFHTGVGYTRYIGIEDDTPSPLTKMNSIPSLSATDRIDHNPFLTPNIGRKRFSTSSNSPDENDRSPVELRLTRKLAEDVVDSANLLRTPFERNFRKSSPTEDFRLSNPTAPPRDPLITYFLNIYYRFAFFRNICGLHRRLLDGSTRQLTTLTPVAPAASQVAVPAASASGSTVATVTGFGTDLLSDHRSNEVQCSPYCDLAASGAAGSTSNGLGGGTNSTTTTNIGIGVGTSSTLGISTTSSLALRRPSANISCTTALLPNSITIFYHCPFCPLLKCVTNRRIASCICPLPLFPSKPKILIDLPHFFPLLQSSPGHRNPSSSSIPMSETGSLDRMKSAAERRKKGAMESDSGTVPTVSGRVEGTRVNTGLIIDELLKNTKLDHLEESGTGLALYISSDGTTTLGSHEVRMPAGGLRQVVMENPR